MEDKTIEALNTKPSHLRERIPGFRDCKNFLDNNLYIHHFGIVNFGDLILYMLRLLRVMKLFQSLCISVSTRVKTS